MFQKAKEQRTKRNKQLQLKVTEEQVLTKKQVHPGITRASALSKTRGPEVSWGRQGSVRDTGCRAQLDESNLPIPPAVK